jgi:aldose 1-epimerase
MHASRLGPRRRRLAATCALLWVMCAPFASSVPSAVAADAPPSVERSLFGRMRDGTEVDLFVLTNSRGLRARVITYGAILTELSVPDREGRFTSVIRGSEKLADYERGFAAAAVMGRVANRIARGRFTLDGQTHQLSRTSTDGHHIHGGRSRFDRTVWQARPGPGDGRAEITLTHVSPDGADGYPGTLQVSVTYTLTDDNLLRITYAATTDRATPVNLTQHAFFNLSGAGDLRDHVLTINAATYTPFDDDKIPTGEIAPVRGTPFDFTTPTPLPTALARAPRGQFDHNLIIDRRDAAPGALVFAARLHDTASGRIMETWTTEPGLQLLTRSFAPGPGDDEKIRPASLCLETQHYPDSVNHPHFPSTILRPGESLHSVTEYRFSTH